MHVLNFKNIYRGKEHIPNIFENDPGLVDLLGSTAFVKQNRHGIQPLANFIWHKLETRKE